MVSDLLWGRTVRVLLLSLVCLMSLSACEGTGVDGDLRAEHAIAGTQFSALELTATLQRARLQTTLDYSSTRVSFAATQSQFLKATLISAGTPPAVLEEFQRNFALTAPPTSALELSPASDNRSAPLQITPFALPSRTPSNVARLENVVTAQGVDANDCARNVTNRFRTDSPQIYVVATAIDIQRGMTISSRWLLRNEEVIRYDFAPDFDIQRACVWFFIDPTDVSFEVGEWSVALDINGQAASPLIPFTIVAP